VWTSLKSLNGREFCFMLNSLIRDDAKLTDEVADQVPPHDGPWLLRNSKSRTPGI
jgi:hypothetical protein